MEKFASSWLNKQEIQAAWSLFKKAESITFLTHYNPDADGVSACAALSYLAEKMGKRVESVYPSILHANLTRQPGNLFINQHKQVPDLLVMCDTASYGRLYFPEVFQEIPSINIDHHISNSIDATINLVTDRVSSACELVYFLLLEWCEKEIDKHIAECLLIGILYDTQIFNTQSTHPNTLQVAADLMHVGANLYELNAELLHTKGTASLRLWGNFLSSIQVDEEKSFAWAVITQADLKKLGVTLASLTGFSNFIAQLSDVDITALIYETEDGKTKASIRSKRADVNKLSGVFGGGGHKNASGILTDIPISEFPKKLVDAYQPDEQAGCAPR